MLLLCVIYDCVVRIAFERPGFTVNERLFELRVDLNLFSQVSVRL